MKQQPFSRALQMMSAIASAMALAGSAQSAALRNIPAYESRGKGRGTGRSVNFLAKAGRSKYQPHIGAKESAKFVGNKQSFAIAA